MKMCILCPPLPPPPPFKSSPATYQINKVLYWLSRSGYNTTTTSPFSLNLTISNTHFLIRVRTCVWKGRVMCLEVRGASAQDMRVGMHQ